MKHGAYTPKVSQIHRLAANQALYERPQPALSARERQRQVFEMKSDHLCHRSPEARLGKRHRQGSAIPSHSLLNGFRQQGHPLRGKLKAHVSRPKNTLCPESWEALALSACAFLLPPLHQRSCSTPLVSANDQFNHAKDYRPLGHIMCKRRLR